MKDAVDGPLFRMEFYNEVVYEQMSEPVVSGDGPWYVTEANHWETSPTSLDQDVTWIYDGTGTYTVVERDGELKVAAEFWTGTLTLRDN